MDTLTVYATKGEPFGGGAEVVSISGSAVFREPYFSQPELLEEYVAESLAKGGAEVEVPAR